MTTFSITMPSAETWTPTFVQSIDEAKCIGCVRCFKVCPRGVRELVGLDADGQRVGIDNDADEDDDGAEYKSRVMTIAPACLGDNHL